MICLLFGMMTIVLFQLYKVLRVLEQNNETLKNMRDQVSIQPKTDCILPKEDSQLKKDVQLEENIQHIQDVQCKKNGENIKPKNF